MGFLKRKGKGGSTIIDLLRADANSIKYVMLGRPVSDKVIPVIPVERRKILICKLNSEKKIDCCEKEVLFPKDKTIVALRIFKDENGNMWPVGIYQKLSDKVVVFRPIDQELLKRVGNSFIYPLFLPGEFPKNFPLSVYMDLKGEQFFYSSNIEIVGFKPNPKQVALDILKAFLGFEIDEKLVREPEEIEGVLTPAGSVVEMSHLIFSGFPFKSVNELLNEGVLDGYKVRPVIVLSRDIWGKVAESSLFKKLEGDLFGNHPLAEGYNIEIGGDKKGIFPVYKGKITNEEKEVEFYIIQEGDVEVLIYTYAYFLQKEKTIPLYIFTGDGNVYITKGINVSKRIDEKAKDIIKSLFGVTKPEEKCFMNKKGEEIYNFFRQAGLPYILINPFYLSMFLEGIYWHYQNGNCNGKSDDENNFVLYT